MSQTTRSKILEEIIIELRKKGLEIPANILSDLKSARTLMKVEQVDQKGHGETSPKIDEYFASVEAYLVTEAGKHFQAEKVDEWLRRLDLATCEPCATDEKVREDGREKDRFIAGVPRDQKWIRVEPIESLPLEKLEQLATETNLSFREEKDGLLTVYGTAEAIKEFLKKVSKSKPRDKSEDVSQ